MKPRRPQQIIIVACGTFVVGFATWAAYTRYKAALDSGPLPKGEALEALRKKFHRELRYCQALGAADQPQCFENRAIEFKEAFFCGELADAKARDQCLIAFVPAVGVFPPCDAVVDPWRRAACLAGAAALLGDGHACKALTQARPGLVAACKEGEACASQNKAIDTLVQACPAMVGGDVAGCPKDDTVCRTAIAARRRNPALCTGAPAEVATCRRAVATITRDASLCGEGDEGTECRSVVARRASSTDCDPVKEVECKGRKAGAGGGAASLCEGDPRCGLYLAYRMRKAEACALVKDATPNAACLELLK